MLWVLTLSPKKPSDTCCSFFLTRLSGLRRTALEVPWSGLLIWMTLMALSVIKVDSPWPLPWRKYSKYTVQVSNSKSMRVSKYSFINSEEALTFPYSFPVIFYYFLQLLITMPQVFYSTRNQDYLVFLFSFLFLDQLSTLGRFNMKY